MALQALPGGFLFPLGPGLLANISGPARANNTMDAANEATIAIGRVATSDGGSHTIDTSGSSSIGWTTGSVTFANAGTTFKVGIAPVDTGNGPPARASNASNVISFDVQASFTGGGGGVTANSWQSSVPTSGTKTIANGDLVAICTQMTARGGADSIIQPHGSSNATVLRPTVTNYIGGTYTAASALPNFLITFSDGALGWLVGSDVFSTVNAQSWNSGSATKEYGQLYQMPFPMTIYGLWGFLNPSADCDLVLYSDPLGTPSAERTLSIDSNVAPSAAVRRFFDLFPSPYQAAANQPIGAVFKPGGSNVTVNYKTINDAAHRVADVFGTSGYGISRDTGAFSNANSSLDHYYIGLLVGAFEHGVAPTYGLGI